MTVWAYQGYYATRTEPVVTPEIDKVRALIEKALDEDEDMGACHIVLGDNNIETHHIEWVLGQETSSFLPITPEGKAAMEAMLAVPYRDRAIALAATDGGFHAWTDEEWDHFNHDGEDPVDYNGDDETDK